MTRPIIALIVAVLAIATPVFAADEAPTEGSLNKLLEVTEVRKLVEGMVGQVDQMMTGMTQQMLQGETLSAEQQEVVDAMHAKMVVVIQDELRWEKLEPIYLKIYRASLTQSEVDGMLAFYGTPTGQAVIRKMPLIMRNSMAAMQETMGPMMKRVQQMAKDSIEDVKAKKAQQSGGSG